MKKATFILIFILVGAFIAISNPGIVQADGIIIIEPTVCPSGVECMPVPHPMAQLDIRYHHVNVSIQDQVATTHVDQVFYNPQSYAVEGTYVFPLPEGAAVKNFVLWVDGKPVEGTILEADQACKIYEDIVRQMRDPALLEYIGRGAVQANVFPIPSKGERRIELEYSQVLTSDNGLVQYQYPLNTEKFSAKPLGSVSITVEVKAQQPVRAVYSPSHQVAVNRQADDTQFTASYEASDVKPDKDFLLFYSVGENEAFHLLSYIDEKDPADKDGFFMLLLAPQPGEPEQAMAKDVILVLDKSGSMEGEKFQQAQSALQYILKHLNPQDRFYISSFSESIQRYDKGLKTVDDVDNALKWVDRLSASGSTDINRALLESAAVVDKERPTYMIFLTDGLPTAGVTDSQKILDNFAKNTRSNLRLFNFGVGYDVDTFLLDSLSQDNHGLSTYVKPGELLDEILSGFYARISSPVIADLSLDFSDLSVYDLYPEPLPDLFAGSQLVLVGRYREGGVADVLLKGIVNGAEKEYRYAEQSFAVEKRAVDDNATELPRLWATRKIGYLLNKIRLKGVDKETVDQIVKLSIRFGIVTPYTSYLVTEEKPLGTQSQDSVSQDTYNQMMAAPTAAPAGREAVEKADAQGEMAQAEVAAPVPQKAADVVKTVGARTFVFSHGVWTDTVFDAQKMSTQKVTFLSQAYFELAQSDKDLAAALAIGERVIIVVNGHAYEVISSDSP